MADDNRGSIADSMKQMFPNGGSRFNIWAMLTLFSMIVIITISDAIPRNTFQWEERFALAVAGISMSIAFIFALFSFFEWCEGVINNGCTEFWAALVICALWVAGTGVILRPESRIATNFDPFTGTELITSPNTYFAAWFSLITSVYLIACFFIDIKSQNRTVVNWTFMVAISGIIIGVSCNVLESICDNALVPLEARCNRTYYAIIFSCIAFAASTVVIFLLGFQKLTPCVEMCFAIPIAALYIVGVILVTSASGPGNFLGSLYFFTWAGAVLSCLISFQSFLGVTKGEDTDREVVKQEEEEEA